MRKGIKSLFVVLFLSFSLSGFAVTSAGGHTGLGSEESIEILTESLKEGECLCRGVKAIDCFCKKPLTEVKEAAILVEQTRQSSISFLFYVAIAAVCLFLGVALFSKD